MKPLLLFLLFLLWGLGVCPLSIELSKRYGLVDFPDQRKIHRRPTPRGAGLVLWLALMLWSLFFADVTDELRLTVTGATVVFFTGYLDDMLSLSPFGRLCAQFVAAGIALISLGKLDAVRMGLVLFWVVGVTNAYNFIDGMNGLSLVMAFMALAFVGVSSGADWTFPLLGVVMGLFCWNCPVARTFVGDGGVYLMGYFLAVQAGRWYLSMDLNVTALCAVLLLTGGVPVIDTLIVILRRLVAGKSPFYPDRTHIHHRLLDRGIHPLAALFLLALLQALSLGGAWGLTRALL